MFNGGSSRWTLSALSSTCVRRICGELSHRPARITYDCRATRNGTTLIEHCCMRIFLAGVSCVGKTTIGAQLAGLLECRFFDLDIETERFFETSIERLRNRHLTSHDFQLAASQALKHVLSREDSYNCVIALPPSGLLGGYWKVVNETRDATIVVLRDTAENILKRITFYDIDSRPLQKHLTDRERGLCLWEIKRDIAYFNRSFRRADVSVDITGCSPNEASRKVRDLLTSAPLNDQSEAS
jgi:shikimate kinase